MTTDYMIGHRFRAASNWAAKPNSGFAAAWPNFHEARYENPARLVYGHFVLPDAVVDWRDVPAHEYRASNARTRFTGAHDYALRAGYQHGFPNWHEASYGAGVVYGTYLIVPGTCDWRDIPANELGLGWGNPSGLSMDYWFRGASDYASRNGYASAMPNGHYAFYNGVWVCGVFLFRPGTLEWRDIRGRELGLPDITPPPPPVPTPPVPAPPPRTQTLFYLDYNPYRISRLGHSQSGRWGRTEITAVVNATPYTLELGSHQNNIVTHYAVLAPSESTSEFNGIDATQNWVGVVRERFQPPQGVGPVHIQFRVP